MWLGVTDGARARATGGRCRPGGARCCAADARVGGDDVYGHFARTDKGPTNVCALGTGRPSFYTVTPEASGARRRLALEG